MENKITSELIEKAKAANSPEELLALAKDNGIEVSEEQAKEYFGQLQGDGELSDEELENVAGGGCANKYPLTNPVKKCELFECKKCGSTGMDNIHCKNKNPTCRDCRYVKMSTYNFHCTNAAHKGKKSVF